MFDMYINDLTCVAHQHKLTKANSARLLNLYLGIWKQIAACKDLHYVIDVGQSSKLCACEYAFESRRATIMVMIYYKMKIVIFNEYIRN
jgi:hypothetical protein